MRSDVCACVREAVKMPFLSYVLYAEGNNRI
nr:MAG TPA: hypothetical protein [Caudoviricetes sp.]